MDMVRDGDGHPVPTGITFCFALLYALPEINMRHTISFLFYVSRSMLFVLDVRGHNVMLCIPVC
jgi:hypothetical protein